MEKTILAILFILNVMSAVVMFSFAMGGDAVAAMVLFLNFIGGGLAISLLVGGQ